MINETKVKQFLELQETIKAAEKALAVLKKEFIATNGGESENYTVVIKDNFRETVAGKEVFADKFGADFLAKHDLLKLSAYNTVVVAQKHKQEKVA